MNWKNIFKFNSSSDQVPATVPQTPLQLPTPAVPPPSILDLEPEQIAARAIRIASTLAALVRQGGMVQMIDGKEYVKVEGWNAMGSLMGFVARIAEVRELGDGGFEAHVELCTKNGSVLSSASARCGMDEKRWAQVPAFSRRSMAITRATGKAYRIQFSWIMALAALSETPAEDMPQYEPPRRDERPPHPAEPFRVKRQDGTKGTFDGRWPGSK